jgi:hypothetical protein
MKYKMFALIMFSISSICAMENSLSPELLGKEVVITEAQWQRLPRYFNRFGQHVVIIKEMSKNKFLLGQALETKKPLSSDVKVQDGKDQVSKYSEDSLRFTLDWQEFIDGYNN